MANSKRKCKGCGEYFAADEMVKFPAGMFCSKSEAIAWALKDSEKARESRKPKVAKDTKEEIKRDRKRLKTLKLDLQPLSYFHKKAQTAFNAFIRARDAGKPCISCGKPDDGGHQRHASHYRSVGACSSLRYHEENVWASCSVCNNYLSGNIGNFRIALIQKLGIERVEWLESQLKTRKWTRDEIEAIEAKYKNKLKELQKD